MKDVRTYNVNIDIKNEKILNENFAERLLELIKLKLNDKSDFVLNFIDDGVSSVRFNNVVNKYIEEVLKKDGNFADRENSVELIQQFIQGLCNHMKALKKSFSLYDVQIIEVFLLNDNYRGKYFRVYLPSGTIDEERYNNLMALGPDWLMGEFSEDIEMKYIIPALFWFLYEVDEYNNDVYLNYGRYQFGLA